MTMPVGSLIRPRALAHRGTVPAAGFLFHEELLGLERTRRRVLAAWVPGARVERIPDGLLLRLPAPRIVDVEASPGVPLVAGPKPREHCLASVPLTPAEWRALDPVAGSIILVHGGVLVCVPPGASVSEEPSEWLAFQGLEAIVPRTVGRIPEAELVASPPFQGRARLGGLPPPPREQVAAMAALQRAGQGAPPLEEIPGPVDRALLGVLDRAARLAASLVMRSAPKRGTGSAVPNAAAIGSPAASSRVRDPLPAWLAALARHLRSKPDSPAASTPPVAPPPPRAPNALQKLLYRAALKSGLAASIGRKHADYVARMLEMFERGDLDQALRHAIPLGGDGAASGVPLLGGLTPRGALEISPAGTTARGALFGSVDLLDDLRRYYRSAFERLERQGRVEEAAFVLAELLHSNEEAVAFLERHGRLRLAAELAEARNLPPAQAVRLWFLAGDRDRAVLLARKSGTFAEAVALLERTQSGDAGALRLLWAQALARSGDFAAAVDAGWPVESARTELETWIDQGIQRGGVAGARMLGRRAVLFPERVAELRDPALELLEDDDPETAPARCAFAAELLSAAPSEPARALARSAVRALLHDLGAGRLVPETVPLHQLAQYSGDAALRADLPPMPDAGLLLRHRAEPLELTFDRSDRGTQEIADAAFLPDGRCLVALGEAGVRLLTRDGRTVVQWSVPAHRLILSDHGDRAIAAAARGDDLWRLSRIDLLSRRAEDWCDARLGAFAPDYNGSIWFAASGKDILALDATATGLKALWRTADVGGTIGGISRTSTACTFLVRSETVQDAWGQAVEKSTTWERWTLELPSLTLRQRREAPPPSGATGELLRAVSASGRGADLEAPLVFDTLALPESLGAHSLSASPRLYIEGRLRHTLRPESRPHQLELSSEWIVAGVRHADGVDACLLDFGEGEIRARLRMLGTEHLAVRLGATHLTLADERGRLLVLDLGSGALIRNLRIV